ncbi:hypothetical protein GGF46_004764, partial [Coemansia sp. RSA 552]
KTLAKVRTAADRTGSRQYSTVAAVAARPATWHARAPTGRPTLTTRATRHRHMSRYPSRCAGKTCS